MYNMESKSKRLQRLKWYILIAAWFCLLASLVSPAFVEPFPLLPFWDHLAMGSVVALSFGVIGENLDRGLGGALLIAPLIAFLLAPLMIARRPQSGWARVLWWSATLPLLLIWVAPPVWQAQAHRPIKLSWSHVMWGFYIYAGAHTLMFVACLMAPPLFRWRRTKAGKVGFPVVYPPSS